MKTTGMRIRELRKKHRLSQKQLAEYLGVAQTAVSGWETSARGTSLDILMEISRVLNEPLQSLLPDVQEEDTETKKTLAQIQDKLSNASSISEIPYEEANKMGIISLNNLLEDEVYLRLNKVEKEFSIVVEKELENISDKALFDVIESVFHLLNKVGKYELYKRALELDHIGGQYKED